MPQRKDPDIPVVTALAICPWPGIDAERIEERSPGASRTRSPRTRSGEDRVGQPDRVSVVYVELKERG